MFAVDCPAIGTRALIFASQVRSVANHDHGIDVAFRCVCGGSGTWRSGANAAGEQLLWHHGPEAWSNRPACRHKEAS